MNSPQEWNCGRGKSFKYKTHQKLVCPNCRHTDISKGRAWDGRRAYRCNSCKHLWTDGMQGRKKKYNNQQYGYQFSNEIV